MKMLMLATLACLAAMSRADVTCDDCLVFGNALQAYLSSDNSLAEQRELLMAMVCADAGEMAEDCTMAVNKYWNDFALAMNPVFLEANSVCGDLGLCRRKRTLVWEPTCDDCKAGVNAVADIVGSEAKIAEIIDFLKGDGFCAGNADNMEECVAVAEGLMPYAMPVLGMALKDRAGPLCCDLSTGGICC